MRRFLVASFAMLGLAALLGFYAVNPVKGQNPPPQIKLDKNGQPSIDAKSLAKVEKELADKYSAFEKSLLTLYQRMANGDDKDKARAAQLKKVLETSEGNNIGSKFSQFIKFLSQDKILGNTAEIDEAVRQSVALAKDLKEILDLLRNDNGALNKKEERLALERFIKELELVIRDQKLVGSQIPVNPDKEVVGNEQRDVTQSTADLKNKLPGKGGADAEPKDMKGEAKPGGKGDKADSKDVGKESEANKASDAKDPGEKGGQAKPSDKKDDAAPKDAKGEAKDAQPSDSAKAGDAKGGDPKSGEGSKAGGEPKPGQTPSKQGESKPGSDSKGQGSSKSASGKPSDQPPPEAAGGKTDNQPAPKGGAAQPKDDMAKAKKRIEEANQNQKSAEDNIAKSKKPEASKDIDKAIDNLESLKKDLERLLRQLREEELERVLANLISRCQKMLAMQEEVLRGTLRVQSNIEATPSKKADRDSILASLNLSDDEYRIVEEATKAIEILETEGSAIAFPEVFQQVREDMKHVQRRLKNTDVGDVTLTIEQDIIDTLREMIKALEKAKKELSDKKGKPKDPKESGPPPDPKLLDKLAELKILRAMQLQVNNRTELYGKRYKGEQAMTEDIRMELRELAGRQERIWEVTQKMAKGG